MEYVKKQDEYVERIDWIFHINIYISYIAFYYQSLPTLIINLSTPVLRIRSYRRISLKTIFLEIVCNDETVIRKNVLETKTKVRFILRASKIELVITL